MRGERPRPRVFDSPQHPYTWGLLGSVPRMDREIQDRLMPIAGAPPSLIRLPRGCAFHPRCPFAQLNGTRSYEEVPELRETGQPDHRVACHLDAETRARLFREEVAPKL